MRIGGEASKKRSMTSNGLWHLLEIFLEGRSVSIPFPSSKTKEPGKNGKMSQWCLLKECFITRFAKVRAAEVYFARFDICFVNSSALGTAIVEEERQVTSGGIDFVWRILRKQASQPSCVGRCYRRCEDIVLFLD